MNLQISLQDGRLCVSVRSEVDQENFRSLKEFREEIKLDRGVILNKMEAFVDKDQARLRIEAPLEEPEAASGRRVNLHIEHTADSKKD